MTHREGLVPRTGPSGDDLVADAARRTLLELSITAAGIGTFDWDLDSGVLAWDERLVEMFGYGHEEFDRSIDGFTARLHPEDVERVGGEIEAARAACDEFASEYRIVVPAPGGEQVRWIGAKGRFLADAAGRPIRMLGAAWDTTVHRETENRIAGVLESMSTAFFSLDTSWRFTYLNAQAEQLLGRSRDELLGGVLWEHYPAAVGTDFETNYRQAMTTGAQVAFEAYYPPPLDAWYEVRAWRASEGLVVYFLDVTDRRRARERAQEQEHRARLLADVTEQLSGTLDPEEAVGRLTQLVVPGLADWCVVSLVDDDAHPDSPRGLRDIGMWHVDPGRRDLVSRYAAVRVRAMRSEAFLFRAISTGQPVEIRTGATASILTVLTSPEAQEIIRSLGPESCLVLPLRGRGRTVGVLTLFRGPERPPLDGPELAAAVEAAGRAGLALDNARLYRQQRDLAEGLQRALLTAPPESEEVELAVRYTPAAEVAQVGGDWYDAFVQPDGATVVVIGDVVGHDTQAAAAMGQMRTIVRTLGAVHDEAPATVLRQVDRVMETLALGTTASAVVARLEPADEQRRAGVHRLRWSNAGHPPPMLVTPDGSVRELTGAFTDLLLGVAAATDRHEQEILLGPGSTVVLYTDGLVERRGQSLEVGLVLLHQALTDLARQEESLAALCDGVLARLLPPRPEDDVALIAVRLHPR